MATPVRIHEPRIGHWGYWRDDPRVMREFSKHGRTRVRIRVFPPVCPPPPPGPCAFAWAKTGV